MNKSLLVKLFGSLLAIMLITACNLQTDEKDATEPQTEQSGDTQAEDTTTDDSQETMKQDEADDSSGDEAADDQEESTDSADGKTDESK